MTPLFQFKNHGKCLCWSHTLFHVYNKNIFSEKQQQTNNNIWCKLTYYVDMLNCSLVCCHMFHNILGVRRVCGTICYDYGNIPINIISTTSVEYCNICFHCQYEWFQKGLCRQSLKCKVFLWWWECCHWQFPKEACKCKNWNIDIYFIDLSLIKALNTGKLFE